MSVKNEYDTLRFGGIHDISMSSEQNDNVKSLH